ncbi:nuclease SbcCD subunit C [Spirochaetia bacterium]|nr:nuclease SbcCD subunit C [Spirochaetia bacterium]
MRPEKLVMENFGPFAGRAELDFSRLEDIFLVTGKTGSGKTTIFDAICFALYGKVPGSRGNHINRLRSDHNAGGAKGMDGGANGMDGGAGDDECMVSLEFSLGDNRYLAERSPRQERKRKRGTGATIAEETVVLYEIIGGKKTNPSSKKTEADQKIRELIGLEAEEFFKIVLLPQGEFAEFLRQNTSERQKVLGKLFPIEKAARVRELAQEKARDAETKAGEAARILGDINSKVSFDTYEAMHREAEDSYQKAREKTAALGAEEARLRRIVALRQKEAETAAHLEESRKEEQQFEAAGKSIIEKETLLSLSRTARPLEQFLRANEQAIETFQSAAAAFALAKEERAAAEKAAAEAESRGAEILRIEGEDASLREKRPALMEMREEEQKLNADKKELENASALIGELEKKNNALQGEREKQEGEIRKLEELAAEGPALEQRMEAERALKNTLMEIRKFRGRLEKFENEALERKNSIAALDKRRAELEKRLPVITEELKNLRKKKSAGERAEQAGHLSANLKAGEPCPVCGSTEHPHPASAPVHHFNQDERIAAQENSLADAERNHAAAVAELGAQKKEVQKLEAEIRALEEEFGEEILKARADIRVPSKPEELDTLISKKSAELNDMLTRQAKIRDAENRIKMLYREQGEAQSKLTENEKELAALGEKEKNLAAAITEKERKHLGLLKSALPAALITPSTAKGARADSRSVTKAPHCFTNAAEALSALDRLIAEQETLLAQYRKAREQAGQALAAAIAGEKTRAQRRDETATQQQEAEAMLKRELENSPFADSRALEKSLLDTETEKALDGEIRGWREAQIEVRSRIAGLEAQLGGIWEELKGSGESAGPGGAADLQEAGQGARSVTAALEDTGRRLDALEAEREQAEAERDKTFAELTALEKDRDSLREAHERHEALSARARSLRNLSNDLSGKNPQKKPFDSWLLGLYLAEVAAFATKRLEKMSESRYSLLLESERESGRSAGHSYTGLDLTVFDAYTGKTRPCATLSGGESFMASISLALGLADSIQSRSGGVRLDAVFIDEGFGSLDEGSLDKALLILDELRDRRMVGLISHVGEMRSRIPCKVEVIKTGSGSRIEY